jgi:hypothetical protein
MGAARQQAVEASWQAAVWQVAAVAPRWAVEEAAPLAVPAPGKGKQVCVVLDDNEVLSDEDEPLQKQLRQLFGARPAELDEKATMMAATDKEAAEEVAMKRATEERATENTATKAAAAKEVDGKTVDEVAGAVEGSPAPGKAPSVAGAKRVAAPRGSTPPTKRPYRGVWKHRFV